MIYARINLSKTNYTLLSDDRWAFINNPDINQLNELYKTYCEYKKFKSVMPIFDSEYTDPGSRVVGYYVNNELVAFSLIRLFDKFNAECVQFAWDYADPKLRLGISSLKHECAVFKNLGYNYLYLGSADEYKQKLDGFEILGLL